MSITKYKDFLLETSSSPIINSVIDVLRISDIPLSCSDIFSKMNQNTLRSTNKLNSLNSTLVRYSENSSDKKPSSNSYFRIVDTSPNKFWLIDRMSELPEEYLNEINPEDIEYSEEYVKKMTFTNAAQKILIDNNNEPMSTSEIWSQISEKGLVETKGKIPQGILLKTMSIHSDNSPVKDRKGTNIFTITQTSPIKFKLINPNKIQNTEDSLEDLDSEIKSEDDIIPFTKFGIPTDFKAVQSQDEKEIKVLEPAGRNPFGGESREAGDEFNSSALFVVGTSGAGKSTRILNLLRENGHKLILIGAENAPSPNLLLDYDQNEGYVPSDISEFIISAKKDTKHFYTIVFDECHEYIDEIKRSILHAISTKRGEKRFFGVRKSVRGFFEDLETYETTSKVVPDNVGFIFISSKPDVFEYHADFMGRVDKVEVKREDPYPYPDLKYIQSKIDRQDQL